MGRRMAGEILLSGLSQQEWLLTPALDKTTLRLSRGSGQAGEAPHARTYSCLGKYGLMQQGTTTEIDGKST